jgi:hypothetical protein
MNVGLLSNDALSSGLRKTRPAMGEIVDLEHYRKLRRRREAKAGETERGESPDVPGTENPNAPTTVKRARPGRSESKGAAKTGGDDSKSD